MKRAKRRGEKRIFAQEQITHTQPRNKPKDEADGEATFIAMCVIHNRNLNPSVAFM